MDSVHQRGLDTTLEEVLTVVQSGVVGEDKNTRLKSSKIAADFDCSATPRGAMDKGR